MKSFKPQESKVAPANLFDGSQFSATEATYLEPNNRVWRLNPRKKC